MEWLCDGTLEMVLLPRSDNCVPRVPPVVPEAGVPTTARPLKAVYSLNPDGHPPAKKAIKPDGTSETDSQEITPFELMPFILWPDGQL